MNFKIPLSILPISLLTAFNSSKYFSCCSFNHLIILSYSYPLSLILIKENINTNIAISPNPNNINFIDVALKSNQFCVMNFDQHIYFNLKFPNNPEGNEMVINKIKDIEDKFLHTPMYKSKLTFFQNFMT